jgi:hypothetical protein
MDVGLFRKKAPSSVSFISETTTHSLDAADLPSHVEESSRTLLACLKF